MVVGGKLAFAGIFSERNGFSLSVTRRLPQVPKVALEVNRLSGEIRLLQRYFALTWAEIYPFAKSSCSFVSLSH